MWLIIHKICGSDDASTILKRYIMCCVSSVQFPASLFSTSELPERVDCTPQEQTERRRGERRQVKGMFACLGGVIFGLKCFKKFPQVRKVFN